MKEIPLTQGKVALVDDEDYERLAAFKWYAQKTPLHSDGEPRWYAARIAYRPRRLYLMHREVMAAPKSLDVDHRFGNGLDNRKENLRTAIHAKNMQNRRLVAATGTSRYLGVYWHRKLGRWAACIGAGEPRGLAQRPKSIHLGCYRDEEAAARAYDGAAARHFGEFAALNFPEQRC